MCDKRSCAGRGQGTQVAKMRLSTTAPCEPSHGAFAGSHYFLKYFSSILVKTQRAFKSSCTCVEVLQVGSQTVPTCQFEKAQKLITFAQQTPLTWITVLDSPCESPHDPESAMSFQFLQVGRGGTKNKVTFQWSPGRCVVGGNPRVWIFTAGLHSPPYHRFLKLNLYLTFRFLMKQ